MNSANKIKIIRTERQLEQGLADLSNIILQEALPLPEAGREERLKQSEKDYFYWFQTYFPHYIDSDFCALHRYIYDQMRKGQGHISILAGPPEHAKTVHASQFIPLWMGLHGLKKFYINLTQTSDLAANNLEYIKLELEINERLIADYGDQRTPGKWEEGDFTIKKGMRFWARGMRQPTRGFRIRQHRPDLIVAEDVDDQKRSKNPDNVKDDIEKLITEVYNRMDRYGMMLIMGNRFRKNTALDKLLTDDQYNFTKRVFPAICRSDNRYKQPEDMAEGVPQWDRFSLEELLNKRDKIGSVKFAGEWQQNPISQGDKFKEEWFQEWTSKDVRRGKQIRILRIDPAFGKTKSSDFRNFIVLERGRHNVALVRHCFFTRCTLDRMVDYTYEIYEEYPNIFAIGIPEELWQGLLDDYFDTGADRWGYHLPIRHVEEKIPKQFRIEGMSGPIERGKVKFNFAEQHQKLLKDQFLFYNPERKKGTSDETHDDGPDNLAGAYKMLPNAKGKKTGYESVKKRGI